MKELNSFKRIDVPNEFPEFWVDELGRFKPSNEEEILKDLIYCWQEYASTFNQYIACYPKLKKFLQNKFIKYDGRDLYRYLSFPIKILPNNLEEFAKSKIGEFNDFYSTTYDANYPKEFISCNGTDNYIVYIKLKIEPEKIFTKIQSLNDLGENEILCTGVKSCRLVGLKVYKSVTNDIIELCNFKYNSFVELNNKFLEYRILSKSKYNRFIFCECVRLLNGEYNVFVKCTDGEWLYSYRGKDKVEIEFDEETFTIKVSNGDVIQTDDNFNEIPKYE